MRSCSSTVKDSGCDELDVTTDEGSDDFCSDDSCATDSEEEREFRQHQRELAGVHGHHEV